MRLLSESKLVVKMAILVGLNNFRTPFRFPETDMAEVILHSLK